MKQLIKKTNIIWFLAISVAFFGCEDDDDANLPQVIASFTQTINEDTGIVSFINLSENADSYEWDFGDGTTSTEINPTKVYQTGSYTVILTAKNVAGAEGTFEDEIFINIPLPLNIPIRFDDSGVNYGSVEVFDTQFQVIANPELSGANDTASNVGEIVSNGVEFKGVTFPLDTPINFSGANNTIQLKLFSSQPGNMLVKFSGGVSGARDVEVNTAHGGTGWELLDFNFSTDAVRSFINGDPQNGQPFVPTGQYKNLDLFVGFADASVSGTFYVDDITFIEVIPTDGCNDVPIAATSLPLDFEGCATFPSEDNFGSMITSELTINPSKTGINTSDFVLKVDKPTGSDFFAGIQNTFADGFDLTTTDIFKLKVYSTKANVVFRFELLANPNDGSIGNPSPVFVTIQNANEWTEVEFSFTNLPAAPTAYNQLVIKPDNDESDSPITNGGTYYLDDLTLNAGDPDPVFDDGLLMNGDFEGGSDSWVSGVGGPPAPVVTEGNNTFYQVNVGAVGTPFSVNLSQQLNIEDGQTYILSFDAWTDASANGRTLIAGVGRSGNPDFANANTNETPGLDNPVLSTTPTRFEYTFMGVPGAADGRVLFDMGDQLGIVNIDNVALFLSGGSCSGGPTMDVVSFPVDFEDCEGFNISFGSNQSKEILDNPVSGGINTSDKVYQFTKLTGADGFGGFQNIFETGSFTNNATITFKIYSTLPSQEIRLEIVAIPNEGGAIGNPAPYAQNLTTANDWVEMSFDLSTNAFPNTSDESVYTMLVVKPGNVDPGTTPADVTFYIDDFNITPN
ncbi:carbohydrate binding domain-containing protein [Aquimarina sp. MMG016]|uniref:carbohydrate binding domain-containing protein n=1 Tax=Aquimarina sp. MMG016 TaxID=2822690 RepID=UPI001B39E9A1|nr:carbohydrate binding domain-containing protein [Aquimarina sp. MMG016]MBQ4822342.1 carbohydrate binding domain-containing protein [Aquimarina sp. MMG016]